MVDVRYEYDALPSWVTPPTTVGGYLGRATGVTDRGQRSAVSYDKRGLAIWTARQMALIPNRLSLTVSSASASYPTITEATPSSGTVSFDEAHTYIETTTTDHSGVARRLVLPLDPDFGGPAPFVRAETGSWQTGAPVKVDLLIDSEVIPILSYASYDQYGAETLANMGQGSGILTRQSFYDTRRRPTLLAYSRVPTGAFGQLQSVQYPVFDYYQWDAANNLTAVISEPNGTERNAAGHRMRSMWITHDSLYRVANVDFAYGPLYQPGPFTDASTDWRNDAQPSNSNDPMHPRPAPRVGTLPEDRVENIAYAYDWLGNQTDWHDDQSNFFERSIGEITNGREIGARPGALYLSSNIPGSGGIESTWGGAGWVEVNYGQGGNVSDYTVHGQCQDRTEPSSCSDTGSSLSSRIANFQANCTCATEQHFSLRWDELNRLIEGRRFDRVGGSVGSGTGAWTYAARMRYRYDGANQRTVKESFEASGINTASRIALFVYPGDFERRGLVRGVATYDAVTTGTDATETQYMIAGARIVWDSATSSTLPNFDRNRRITYALTDLLQTSGAVVDLVSGELLELSTYYPNGARENLWASDSNAPLEPMGFTGKEADEEIGLTYFGERWLMPRLGRWASPDPLHVHASGGGEALNSYHYVSGNLLQARDPNGLDMTSVASPTPAPFHPREEGTKYLQNEQGTQLWATNAAGDVMQMDPRGPCAQRSSECFDSFIAQARSQSWTVHVYMSAGSPDGVTPGGCSAGVVCGNDGGETAMDDTVWVLGVANGDQLTNPGCEGGGTCTGGVPGGTGTSDSPLWQFAYIVREVVGMALGAVMGVFSRTGGAADDAAEEVAEEVADDLVDVYRGVHAEHPELPEAMQGRATPWGGHTDVDEHSLGDNASEFTSWTTAEGVAERFAEARGPGGVVLHDRAPASSLRRPSEHIEDMHQEREVLRQGPISGANVRVVE